MDRTPRGISRLDDGEVKHIDHLAMQEGAVAFAPGDELCHGPAARGEDLPVEEAVDDVPKSTSDDETKRQAEAE